MYLFELISTYVLQHHETIDFLECFFPFVGVLRMGTRNYSYGGAASSTTTKEGLLRSYGAGEYHVSILPNDLCIVRPLSEDQIIVDPEMIMKMIAARDGQFDL